MTAAEPPIPPVAAGHDLVTIDTSQAHTARVYDFLLGGTDNFAVDREVATYAFSAYPNGLDGVRADARANRAFLTRAVRYLVGEAGIRQLLDIGSGIPSAGNTHEVARALDEGTRVVYVDNDPIVLAHAHTLLDGAPDGTTAFVPGDVEQPDAVLDVASRTLDLDQPVGLVLVGLLHVVPDAHAHVQRLVDALAPGSYLVISHMCAVTEDGTDLGEVGRRLDERMHASNPPALRSRDDVARFFTGLELVPPGLVPVTAWRPDAEAVQPVALIGGVARKP